MREEPRPFRVEHVRQQPSGHAKAMLVTRTRLHAVRYRTAFDAYITKKGYNTGPHKIAALVVFAGTVRS